MWFLARMYNAEQALQMGLVNTVVPLDQLETETLVWYVYHSGQCCLLCGYVCLSVLSLLSANVVIFVHWTLLTAVCCCSAVIYSACVHWHSDWHSIFHCHQAMNNRGRAICIRLLVFLLVSTGVSAGVHWCFCCYVPIWLL